MPNYNTSGLKDCYLLDVSGGNMEYRLELTDRLPNGKLETAFVVSVRYDRQGSVIEFEAGGRERALVLTDVRAAQEISAMVMDFEIDLNSHTYVGIRKIEA
jgi:hypothetical protein